MRRCRAVSFPRAKNATPVSPARARTGSRLGCTAGGFLQASDGMIRWAAIMAGNLLRAGLMAPYRNHANGVVLAGPSAWYQEGRQEIQVMMLAMAPLPMACAPRTFLAKS